MKRPIFLLLAMAGIASGQSIQDRIDAAQSGATILVASGTYTGAITIGKSVSLVGEGKPLILGSGHGKVVQINASDVTLRGFRVAGSGLALSDDDAAVFVTADRATIEENEISESLHGIYVKKANHCRIAGNRVAGKTSLPQDQGSVEKGIGSSAENCDVGSLVQNRRGNGIHLWNCEANEIVGNEISDARDGIYFSFANHCNVTDNRIHHVRYGLHYMYSDDNVFLRNVFSENAAGAALMFSERLVIRDNQFVNNRGLRAYGLIFQSVDDTRLEANRIEQNAVGLSFNQCNRNRVTGNDLGHNYIGLRFGSNSDENVFSRNVLLGNLHPVEMLGDNGSNHWALAGVGNRWEDATEFDLDHDGINELPHRELDLFGVLRRDFPAVAFLSGSPATKLMKFAHQRATVPGLHSIDDPAPLASGFVRHPNIAAVVPGPVTLSNR